MKPLILILLAAAYAAAQTPTVADVARQERARRAQSRSSKVYTTEDIRTTAPAEEAEPAAAGTEVSPDAKAAPATAESAPDAQVPQADPTKQWLMENEKLREQLRELMDQEAIAQLEINTATNQLNAPISTQSAKDEAGTKLQAANQKLATIRERIAKSRSELQEREAKGPPRK
jgi:hypothetical protein